MDGIAKYYDDKAKEARALELELADKLEEFAALTEEIMKLKRRIEQARYVGD